MPKPGRNTSAPPPQQRPVASSSSTPSGESSPQPAQLPGQPLALSIPLAEVDATALKADLLSSLREEIKTMFKTELQMALGENLTAIKSELHAFKTQIASDIAVMKQDFAGLRGTVTDMEQSLSTCTDDIISLRNQMQSMAENVIKLENKCEDLESRSRRNNVRVVGVSESHSVSSEYVSNLLMEAFSLTRAPLVDRAHQSRVPANALALSLRGFITTRMLSIFYTRPGSCSVSSRKVFLFFDDSIRSLHCRLYRLGMGPVAISPFKHSSLARDLMNCPSPASFTGPGLHASLDPQLDHAAGFITPASSNKETT
uniref:Uncharacterized protein n=1 Tax=Knipowitschia caucasica TaxID=637954 RepID=A0AAV2JUE4_KNICA